MAVPAATKDASSGGAENQEQGVQEDTTTDSMERKRSGSVSLEPRPLRPFTSEEEYIYAMKEDLAEWLRSLYEDLQIDVERFFEELDTGVILCRHANRVLRGAREAPPPNGCPARPPWPRVTYREGVQPGTFRARDNVSQFISWCRGWLRVKECLLFETDDLVERKNERNVVLCLLEVARRGCDLCEGMPAPLLVQMEREIDAEIARDERRSRSSPLRSLRRPPSWLADAATMTTIESSDDGGTEEDSAHQEKTPRQNNLKSPQQQQQQIITNDLRSLHQRVADLLNRCSCPSQFPMLRVADGKYRIGDTQVLIFVRVLRNHVMVRVGGGWDTLEHYLEKHDPCRGRTGRRLSSSKTGSSPMKVQVTHQRPRSCGTPSTNRSNGIVYGSPSPTPAGTSRRRSFDLSRLSSPDDRSVCSSSSRTPSRGSSPGCALDEDFPIVQDDWNSIGQNRPSSATGRRQKQLRNDCSSSEVSEEGTAPWRVSQRPKTKSSPRKIMRYAEHNNGYEDSEPDSIFSSPPRSLDGLSKNHRNQKPHPRRGPDSFSSFGSDDSAVSLGSGDGSAPSKLSSNTRCGNNNSKIPKSSRRYQSSENLSLSMGHPLSSSRSETSLFGSLMNTPRVSGNYQQRGRRTSPSTNRLPRSNSGLSSIAVTTSGGRYSSTTNIRRRSASATRTSYSTSSSPVKERRPTTGPTRPVSSNVAPVNRRRRSEASSTASSRQTSPSKPVAPLLEEILHDSEMLDTDEKLLRRMERLINQYRAKANSVESQDEAACHDLEDVEYELTEDATVCRSLSPDDDVSFSLSSSLKAPNSLPVLAPNATNARQRVKNSSKGSTSTLVAKSPSRIPVFTAWQFRG